MCGIAGMVALGSAPRPTFGEASVERVRRMCSVQAHRGPDDAGAHAVGRAVLGSVRLAILDLSPAGHMPMADAGEQLHLIRSRVGRWGNVQLTDGEVVLRPEAEVIELIRAAEKHLVQPKR